MLKPLTFFLFSLQSIQQKCFKIFNLGKTKTIFKVKSTIFPFFIVKCKKLNLWLTPQHVLNLSCFWNSGLKHKIFYNTSTLNFYSAYFFFWTFGYGLSNIKVMSTLFSGLYYICYHQIFKHLLYTKIQGVRIHTRKKRIQYQCLYSWGFSI